MWRPRRGSAANALLVALCGAVTVGVSVIVFQPQMLAAGGPSIGGAAVEASDPVNQTVIEQLARIISVSREVLYLHQPDESPFLEVLLWVTDAKNPGQIDPEELALISYSRTLEAVTFHSWEPPEHDPRKAEVACDAPSMASRSAVATLAFCDAWRGHRCVTRRVIATRVRAMEIQPLEDYRPSIGPWRITLTWAADSADHSVDPNRIRSQLGTPDTASVTVAIDARQSKHSE